MTDTAQSGISDNGAGALAYITIIPAIVFLAIPPYNKSSYVRFHAWQCIFLCIAWIALAVVLAIAQAVIGRILFVGFFIFGLNMLLFLTMFILWLVVVLKALNGQKFMVPIIGPLAEAQAAK